MNADNLIDLRYATAAGVATITINRPDRHNAMRPNTLREMADILANASDDAGVGVVVITGAGERAFCAGGDLSQGAGAGDCPGGGRRGGRCAGSGHRAFRLPTTQTHWPTPPPRGSVAQFERSAD